MKQIMTTMAIASSLLITACSSSDNNSQPPTTEQSESFASITIDASDYQAKYIILSTGELVSENEDWDIGFDRNNIFDKNKGILVNNNKLTAIADTQNEKYNGDDFIAQNVVNATASTEEPDFVSANIIIGDYIASDVQGYIDASDWYIYSHGAMGPSLSANADNLYLLTSAEGDSYAKMHVSDITNWVATFSFYVEGDAGFSESSIDFIVDLTATAVNCYDFDSAQTVDCNSNMSTWDIKADIVSDGQNSEYNIYLNGGASGTANAKAYGPIASTDFDYTSAEPTAENGLNYAYASDSQASAFSEYAWYAYHGTLFPEDNSKHDLYPLFHTYVVDTDASSEEDTPIKFQIISYYSPESGASGHVTIRFAEFPQLSK